VTRRDDCQYPGWGGHLQSCRQILKRSKPSLGMLAEPVAALARLRVAAMARPATVTLTEAAQLCHRVGMVGVARPTRLCRDAGWWNNRLGCVANRVPPDSGRGSPTAEGGRATRLRLGIARRITHGGAGCTTSVRAGTPLGVAARAEHYAQFPIMRSCISSHLLPCDWLDAPLCIIRRALPGPEACLSVPWT
jgi:hypothetical protein